MHYNIQKGQFRFQFVMIQAIACWMFRKRK
ncbi:Protein of unknown function [Bacillus wiedmannii]|uniref:IS6 family transposase n=1 Tax=Bacillus wiedmannii TaxID=1890302 RepID=A0AB37YTJ7_9BACI|nr:Protein of unknown function [Bacillus wiedmannii]